MVNVAAADALECSISNIGQQSNASRETRVLTQESLNPLEQGVHSTATATEVNNNCEAQVVEGASSTIQQGA